MSIAVVEGPIRELLLEIPDSEKYGLYYSVVSLFVVSTVVATILTLSFLVLSILLWRNFKSMRFFWFLTQLTTSAFIISASNLFINIPAALSLFSKEVTQSQLFYFFSYLIDFCHYSILFSNLVISIQRAFVFFLRNWTNQFFESKAIYIWLASIYIFAFGVEYALMSSNCQYGYDKTSKNYQLVCEADNRGIMKTVATPAGIQFVETLLHIVIPLFILIIYIAITARIIYMKGNTLSKNETLILKQAIFVFLIFQASSCVFLFAQYFQITYVAAFLVKRFVNTMEILAGAATPSFFFFTSKEIRKLVSTRVSAASSLGPSNIQVRAARTLE